MAGRTKMPSLTGKREKTLMTAATALNSGKSIMEYAAVQILVYYFFYMGPQVAVFLAEFPIIRSLKLFIIVFYAAVIRSVLGLSPSVLFGAST